MSVPMGPLRAICVTALLAAGPANAQSMDDAVRLLAKKDYERATPILEKLSAEGNAEAQNQLAAMYVGAIGVPRNTVKGIGLYESASSKGHPEAQFVLATELFKGQLINPDKKRGVSLLFASAKQKYAYAQFALCVELSTDESQYYDAIEAYAWCETSSKKDHRHADRAVRRGTETLGKILARQGANAVQLAKTRAIAYAKEY